MESSPVDLGKLTIDGNPQGDARPRSLRMVLVPWAVCFLLGLLVGIVLGPCLRRNRATSVRTVVAGPGRAQGGKSFTAGGWIEAAAPCYPIMVCSRTAERLVELKVKEGDAVTAGQTLATLYDADVRLRLGLAEARLEGAAQELAKRKTGYRKEDILLAESRARASAEALRLAQANCDRSRNLPAGAVSAEQLDREVSQMRQAAALNAADEAELARMRAGFRAEEIAAAEADVKEAQAQLGLARNALAYCTVTAPEGLPPLRVLKVLRRVGDFVKDEMAVLSLYDPADMQVRADVTQANIRFVKVGGKARIRTEAGGGKEYAGTVLRIDPLADLAKNTVIVRARIDDPDEMLFPEMVAHISFAAAGGNTKENEPSLVSIPEGALLTDKAGEYVLVCEGGRARRCAVTVASRTGGTAMVSAGLEGGERVIVSGLEGLRDGSVVKEE